MLSEATEPIEEIPEEHRWLIALLAVERCVSANSRREAFTPDLASLLTHAKIPSYSDKMRYKLAGDIKAVLMGTLMSEDSQEADDGEGEGSSSGAVKNKDKLPVESITHVLSLVVERVNHGLDASASTSSSTNSITAATAARLQQASSDKDKATTVSVPASLQLWRHEIKADVLSTLPLPAELKTKLETRRAEREKAREQATALFLSLDAFEQDVLLLGKKKAEAFRKAHPEVYSAQAASDEPIDLVDSDAEETLVGQPSSSATALNSRRNSASPVNKRTTASTSPSASSASSPSKTPSKGKESKTPKSNEKSAEKSKAKTEADAAKRAEQEEKAKVREQKRLEKEAEDKIKAEKKAEREAKKREREEEKRLKEEAEQREREKKEQKAQKVASFMGSFFKKQESPATAKDGNAVASGSGTSGALSRRTPELHKSDYERCFFPCEIPNLAPISRFDAQKSSKDATALLNSEMEKSPAALLAEYHKGLSFPLRQRRARPAASRKGFHPETSVREVMHLVRESDILGQAEAEKAKEGLAKLQSRRKIPIKLLQFNTDRRPGWYGELPTRPCSLMFISPERRAHTHPHTGTWTRGTNIISARKPLAQDSVQLNYSVDSADEWEEEGEGEDLMDDDDAEDAFSSDEDSDMDDWLEDDLHLDPSELGSEDDDEDEDDDVVVVDGSPVKMTKVPESSTAAAAAQLRKDKVRAAMLAGAGAHKSRAQRQDMNKKKKKGKKRVLGRRFTAKLIPFSSGPHWEVQLGQAVIPAFQPYSIEFLNDAHAGINPFTFDAHAEALAAKAAAALAAKQAAAQAAKQAALEAAIAAGATPEAAAEAAEAVGKKSGKAAFPDEHTAAFIKALEGLEEGRRKQRQLIVALVHEELNKIPNVSITKGAVDGKLSEVAERKKGVWQVKEDYRTSIE